MKPVMQCYHKSHLPTNTYKYVFGVNDRLMHEQMFSLNFSNFILLQKLPFFMESMVSYQIINFFF